MCGIVTVYNKGTNEVKKEVLEGMTQVINHRGPDDTGYYYHKNVGMGFKRLSIIDLSTGMQPMSNEDGKLWLVFNGEIYNYLDLREILIAKGHKFHTNTDSEVVLHLYEEYGVDSVTRLRGMFAFTIHDQVKNEIFGARDYFGIKPLYYTSNPECSIFASEIKSIVEHPSVARKINPQAYLNYLTFQYVPEPDTMFEGINKIPPGHYFRIDSSGIHLASYFSIQFKPEPERKFEDFVAEVRETIDNSVNAHRVSDVPRGAFLSSGVDSTIITAMMKQYEDIKTFSVGYNEGKYSELSDAKKSAEKLGTEHHEYIITAAEYQSMLPKLAWHQDEPVADPSAISIFFLARMAREHITVVLSGEGADELFGGYNIYHEPTSLRVFNYVPSLLNPVIRSIASLIPDGVSGKSFLLRGTQSLENRFFGNARIFGTEAKKRITNLDRNTFGKYFDATRITKPWYQRCAGLDDETRMQYIDLNTWLPGNILMKADKMTMANSLELRVPFLDIEVLKLIQRIPTKYKITAGTTKYVLRQAFKDILPPDVTSKRKLGFPVPLRLWLKKEFYPWAIEQLSTGDCQPWVNKTHALKLLEDHKAGKADNSRPLWTILMFLLWKDAFRVSA